MKAIGLKSFICLLAILNGLSYIHASAEQTVLKRDSLKKDTTKGKLVPKTDTAKNKPVQKKEIVKSKGGVFFEKYVTISQSTATSEQLALPAQFLVTVPKGGKASILADAGIGISLNSIFKKWKPVIAFTTEYHRNTMVDSVQNNFQIGLKGTFPFWAYNNTTWYLIADPKYAYDAVKKTNSVASDLLFTWGTYKSTINFNTYNIIGSNSAWRPSVVFGTQLQQVFPSDTTMAKGFILRPTLTGKVELLLYRDGKRFDPSGQLSLLYDQRVAVINKTNSGEKFTHLFKAEADYFIISKPLKVSVSASLINGSDPLQGLKQQQYFLFSLNVSKTISK
jgi:hypothetical protein